MPLSHTWGGGGGHRLKSWPEDQLSWLRLSGSFEISHYCIPPHTLEYIHSQPTVQYHISNTVARRLTVHIQLSMSSNLQLDATHPRSKFYDFTNSSWKMLVQHTEWSHDLFLQHLFRLIIHTSSYHCVLYNQHILAG